MKKKHNLAIKNEYFRKIEYYSLIEEIKRKVLLLFMFMINHNSIFKTREVAKEIS